jgi:hypothetical protein
MSLCVITQTHDNIFAGTDTALSIPINGKNYRLSLESRPICGTKIFSVGNKLIYCSGFNEFVSDTLEYIATDPTNEAFSKWLNKTIISPYPETDLGYSVVICEIKKGISLVRCFVSKNNYECKTYTAKIGQINIITSGFGSDKAYENTMSLMQGAENIDLPAVYQKVYNSLACNEVGGQLLLYRVSDKSLIYSSGIEESGIDYHYIQSEDEIKVSIAANMGILTAGSITANCSIDIGTNASVGDSLSVGNELALRTFGRITVGGSTRFWFYSDSTDIVGIINTGTVNASGMNILGQPVATQQWVLSQIPPPAPPPPPAPASQSLTLEAMAERLEALECWAVKSYEAQLEYRKECELKLAELVAIMPEKVAETVQDE